MELGAEQEAGGTGLPMQMGGFVAPKPRPRAQVSVVGAGARGAMGWAEDDDGVLVETGVHAVTVGEGEGWVRHGGGQFCEEMGWGDKDEMGWEGTRWDEVGWGRMGCELG